VSIQNIPVAALLDIALFGHMILGTTVAASTLLAVGAILGNVIGGLADLAGTGRTLFLTLLLAITNAMTFFATEVARDLGLLDDGKLFGAPTLGVADLVAGCGLVRSSRERSHLPVVAVVDLAIHGYTSVGETFEVVGSILGPLGNHVGARGFVTPVVTDGVLLAHVALEVNIGHGREDVLDDTNEIHLELALAELLLEVDIGQLGLGLDQDLDSILEVVEVTLKGSTGQEVPSFSSSLVGHIGIVNLDLVLALDSLVALLVAELAFLGLARAVTGLMTLLVAFAASTSEDLRLGAVGLSMTFLALVSFGVSEAATGYLGLSGGV
jgi:hypothetical protein